MYIIEFSPPMENLEGAFNTVRMGLKLSKVLSVGDHVLLIDKPKGFAFGQAEVTAIHVGTLQDMATLHAGQNHNQKHLPPESAAERLIANMQKRYGPQIAKLDKKVTVIYLRRL